MITALRRARALPYLGAALLSAVYFLFHFHFMQQFLDWDQIVYANNVINSFSPSRPPLFNPHHLHLEIMGKQIHRFIFTRWGKYGFDDLVLNNRLWSALWASLGLFFAVLFLKNITRHWGYGLLGSLIIAFGHGYLLFATKFDTPIFPAAAMIILLWYFDHMRRGQRWLPLYGAGAGCLLFLALMFHQYMAIVCVALFTAVIAPAWLFPRRRRQAFDIGDDRARPAIDRSPRQRTAAALLMTLTATVLTAATYFYAGKTVYNLPFDRPRKYQARGVFREGTFQQWLFLYASSQSWGQGITEWISKLPFRGYTDGWLSQQYPQTRDNFDIRFEYDFRRPTGETSLVKNQLAYFLITVIMLLLFLWPAMWRRYGRSLLFILISVVGLTLFFTYWMPNCVEFWTIPVLLTTVLAVLALHSLGEFFRPTLRRWAHLPSLAYLLFLWLLFANHNMLHYVVPYSRVRHTEGISSRWERDYYMKLFTHTYRFRYNPYKTVYGTRRGRPLPRREKGTTP